MLVTLLVDLWHHLCNGYVCHTRCNLKLLAQYLIPVLSVVHNRCCISLQTFLLLFQPRRDGILLPVLCVIRTVFLPLFVFCNALPRNHDLSYFREDYFPMVFMGLFAISNGYLGSLCMMYGPT